MTAESIINGVKGPGQGDSKDPPKTWRDKFSSWVAGCKEKVEECKAKKEEASQRKAEARRRQREEDANEERYIW